MPRTVFFRANPYWTLTSQQAVTHAVFIRARYAEQGDYEVARNALQAVTIINPSYVEAKGKTFFSHQPLFENPQAPDNFISDTLEGLRLLAQAATARNDEEQIRQILTAMAGLVRAYLR